MLVFLRRNGLTPHPDNPFSEAYTVLYLCFPSYQVLRKEQALSEDSGFLKEQMEKLLKVCTIFTS